MATLGFEDYIEPLKVYLTRYREVVFCNFFSFVFLSLVMVWSCIMVFRFSVPVEVTNFLFVCFCYGLNGMLQMEVCHGLRLSYLIVYNFMSVRVCLCVLFI